MSTFFSFNKPNLDAFKLASSYDGFSIPIEEELFHEFQKNNPVIARFITASFEDDFGLIRVQVPLKYPEIANKIWLAIGDRKGIMRVDKSVVFI